MPFIKLWVHIVWSTKKREPFLTKDIRQIAFRHIRENAATKNIHVDFVNGYTDHAHCLVSLTQEQIIAKVIQLIKGESSFWINKNNLCKERFEWQDDYFAVSVSESHINIVRDYIKNQEAHHAKKTFQEEHLEFVNRYGFVLLKG